jgi:hypothetical protein
MQRELHFVVDSLGLRVYPWGVEDSDEEETDPKKDGKEIIEVDEKALCAPGLSDD